MFKAQASYCMKIMNKLDYLPYYSVLQVFSVLYDQSHKAAPLGA